MKVRIYTEAKSTMQSGRAGLDHIVVEAVDLGARQPEPVMGWTSSPDTLNQIRLSFDSLADAVRHAQNQNWDYTVEPAQMRRVKPRNYTDGFRYVPPEEDAAKA